MRGWLFTFIFLTASVSGTTPGFAGTLEYTVETSPTGKEILVHITTGAGLETVDGAVFRVHLRSSGQEIPVGGLSFVDNRITLELDERIIHDDKEDVGLSYIAGSVRDVAGSELPYFLDADIDNRVLYLHDDPAEGASHFLSSRGVEFGISDSGGGYASRLTIAGVDINAPGYGRGVQSAYRSGLHANAYNPSQAGVRDDVGTLVRAREEDSAFGPGGRVDVDPFRIALFMGEQVFDHLENEFDYVVDNFTGDGGNSDTDGIDETGMSWTDELRSELEYATWWEDASDLVNESIGLVRRGISLEYACGPGPIECFGLQATRDDGTPVLEERFRMTDVSPWAIPGLQEATDVDLSFITASFAVRPRSTVGFRYVMWIEEGTNTWSNLEITEATELLRWKQTRNADLVLLVPTAGRGLVSDNYLAKTGTLDPDFDMVLAADGTDPDNANAIGLLMPRHIASNRDNVVRVHSGGCLSHAEDRLIASYVEADLRSSGDDSYIYLRTRNRYTGLLSPQRLAALDFQAAEQGEQQFLSANPCLYEVTEMLRQEVYYLFGTPNQIKAAVLQLARTAPGLSGGSLLSDGNPCSGCAADIDRDGEVGGADLSFVLAAWGPCVRPDDCPADLTRNGDVSGEDLAALLGAWGPCRR